MSATELSMQAVICMIGISAVWVFMDAKARGFGENQAAGWLLRAKPATWAALTLFMWIGAFLPVYLVVRTGRPVIKGREDWVASLLGWLVIACAAVAVVAANAATGGWSLQTL